MTDHKRGTAQTPPPRLGEPRTLQPDGPIRANPTERGQLVVWLDQQLLRDNTDSRRLAEALLDSEWLKQRVADAARAAAEKAWDQALLTAADKLPAPLQLAGEFLRGMVAGGANPYRADDES